MGRAVLIPQSPLIIEERGRGFSRGCAGIKPDHGQNGSNFRNGNPHPVLRGRSLPQAGEVNFCNGMLAGSVMRPRQVSLLSDRPQRIERSQIDRSVRDRGRRGDGFSHFVLSDQFELFTRLHDGDDSIPGRQVEVPVRVDW